MSNSDKFLGNVDYASTAALGNISNGLILMHTNPAVDA
jgi:hypothetical protein